MNSLVFQEDLSLLYHTDTIWAEDTVTEKQAVRDKWYSQYAIAILCGITVFTTFYLFIFVMCMIVDTVAQK